MPPVFELRKNDEDYYYFHFLNGEGELILLSAEYPEKASAEAAINDVRVGSLTANQIAAGRVAGGETFFVIKDTAGDVLVKSVLYNDRMRLLQRNRLRDNELGVQPGRLGAFDRGGFHQRPWRSVRPTGRRRPSNRNIRNL